MNIDYVYTFYIFLCPVNYDNSCFFLSTDVWHHLASGFLHED